MAVTDEALSDEVLVQELERLRLHNENTASLGDCTKIWDPNHVLFGLGSQEFSESPLEACASAKLVDEAGARHPRDLTTLSHTSSLPSFPLARFFHMY